MSETENLTINNLVPLLQLSILRGYSVLDQKITRLTAPGENYGSLMLLVRITYKDADNHERKTTMVAKKIPENEWLQQMFKVHITFEREMEFYKSVVPSLIQFQRDRNVKHVMDFFPAFYGGQINSNCSHKVDEDAVILLENLKTSGFVTGERTVGFDLETTELVLKDLAVFHAVPIALKLCKPDLFQEKIMPHVKVIQIFDGLSQESEDMLVQEKHDLAKENVSTAHLANKILERCRRAAKAYKNPCWKSREPFATIRHNDFWVNNTMIKYEGGKPVKTKLIDFQTIDYGSPAKDVVFFLFTSVEFTVIKGNYGRLLNLYYETFVDTLEELKCDINKFSFEDFLKEMELEARSTELFHVLNMLKPIYVEQDTVKPLKDFSESDLNITNLSDMYKIKSWYVMEEFAKRDWI